MRVFLIHGMGRTPVSMGLLALRLGLGGHRTSLFGYTVTLESLDSIAARFRSAVERTVEADREAGHDGAYAVIGHSLGNIVTRLASPELPDGFRRFAMIAPPNHPPAIARRLEGNPVFRAITRDAGECLCDDAFYERLPVPDVPMMVIAGTAGPQLSWLPFDGENDGIVSLAEARLGDVPVVEVPALHTFLMNRLDVSRRISSFLDTGEAAAPAA